MSRAESGRASIAVRVRDAVSAPVRAVEVTLAFSGGPRLSEATDAEGHVFFENAPAGAFDIAYRRGSLGTVDCPLPSRPAFATVPGETLVVGLTLAPDDPASSCRAVAEVRDRFVMFSGSRYGVGDLRGLPSSGNVWSLLETAEPAAIVDRMDGAGLYLGEPGRFSMRGSSWTQNNLVLDGHDITDPARGGVPLAYPGLAGLEAIGEISALAPVEHAAPGVTLSFVPRDPGPEWHGSAQLGWQPSGLQTGGSASDPPAIARFGSWASGGFVAGGPLLGDRLRTLVAGSATDVARLERADPVELQARVGSLFNHTVWRPSQADRLSLVTSFEAVSRPLRGRARFSGETPSQRDDFLGSFLRWDHAGATRSWSAFAGFQSGWLRSRTEGLTPDLPVERLEGPVPEQIPPGRSRRATWTVGGSLALRGRSLLGLWHTPRLGLTLAGASAQAWPGSDAPTPELVDGLPARVWEYGWAGPVSRRQALDVGAYVADRLTFRDRVFLEAGLRLDATTGSADGAPEEIAWRSLSPRVSARVRVADWGRLAIFGGFAEYRHRLLLDHLAFADPAGPQGQVYRWNDTNRDGLFDSSERGVLVSRVGPGAADGTLASIDPELAPPRTREWVVGIEGSVPGGLVLRFTGFDRRERYLVEAVNVGVPSSGYTVSYVPDPSGDIAAPQDDQMLPIYERRPETFGLDRYLLTNPAGHEGLHQGAELRVEKAFGSRLRFVGGATAVRTEVQGGNRGFRVTENDQGVVGELYDSPNADQFAKGRSFFDRAFTIKIAATYLAPGDVLAGVVARYQDGQPFGRFVVVSDLAQGPEAIPAVPRGQIERGWAKDDEGRYIVPSGHRFEFTLTVDVRVEKKVRWGDNRIAFACEVFNLLGNRHEVEEDAVWGPLFRDPTAAQPPLAVRLGLRLDF